MQSAIADLMPRGVARELGRKGSNCLKKTASVTELQWRVCEDETV